MLSRRTILAAVRATLLGGASVGNPRLGARPPAAASKTPVEPGLHSLGLRKRRDALLYVPKLLPESAAPFLICLHGATGSGERSIERFREQADALGIVLLGPSSAGNTWDAIRGGFAADGRAIDNALAKAFAMCHVDPKRVGVCGFSDGASYALGLGLANGDLFGSIMAFSPGFIPGPIESSGKPRLFLSHGTRDEILPIESCSRRIVPELKRNGYDVTYIEFDGPHRLLPEIAEKGLRWFLG